MIARDQLGQIFALLRRIAVAADLVDAEIGMGAVGQADSGGRTRNLLHRDAMFEIAEPRPAIFLLDRNAVQAERADLGPEIAGELVGLVDLGGTRGDLVARETVHRLADGIRSLAEIEIEDATSIGDHGGRASRENS